MSKIQMKRKQYETLYNIIIKKRTDLLNKSHVPNEKLNNELYNKFLNYEKRTDELLNNIEVI